MPLRRSSTARADRVFPPVTLVLGGARSGKSRYAERLVEAAAPERHLSARPPKRATPRWPSASPRIGRAAAPFWTTRRGAAGARRGDRRARRRRERPVLVDCLTLWLSNLLLAGSATSTAREPALLCRALREARRAGRAGRQRGRARPRPRQRRSARAFRDHAGRLNQAVAALADRVVFVAAGLPLVLKERHEPCAGSPPPSSPAFSAPARPASCGICWRMPRAGASRVIVNEFGELGIDRELLLGCGDRELRRGRHRRAGQWLHLLHRRRRFPADHDAAARPRRRRPSTSSSRPRASRCRSRWCRPSPGPRSAPASPSTACVAGDRRRGGGRRALRRRSRSASPRQRAADPALDHDNPLEEVFADQLACADLVDPQQDRPGRRRRALRGARAARSRRSCGPAVKLVARARGQRCRRRWLLGLAAAAEDDLAARPSHHELEGGARPRRFRELRRRAAARSPIRRRFRRAPRRGDRARTTCCGSRAFSTCPASELPPGRAGVGDRVQHYFDRAVARRRDARDAGSS